MWFWFFTLFFCLLIPGTMLLFGFLWKSHPPKDINAVYGYRTSMSCKSQATWAFAHQTAGKLWRRWGVAALALTVLAYGLGSLFLLHGDLSATAAPEYADLWGYFELALVAIQLALCIIPVFSVERALKRHFDLDGNPKT